MKKNVPVNKFTIGEEEKKLVIEAMDTGWISSEGPFVKQFEEEMASKVGRKFGIAVANGTVALDIAVQSLELSPGDEVILPSFTIISCSEAICKVGAIPRFIDCHPQTWNIDVDKIEAAISSNTKAIMVVHIYGLTVDMDPIFALAKKYNLKIIEDAAEAHGQEYFSAKSGKKMPCGSMGDVSVFSFYPNKHITTGEGGMILTDDAVLAEKIRSLRNLCFVPERRFVHYEAGTNARLSNILAAIGLGQLHRLDQTVETKKKLGLNYQKLLGKIPDITLPLEKTSYCQNHYWVFSIVFGAQWPELPIIEKELASHGVGTRPFFYGLHQQPLYKNRFGLPYTLSVTEKLSSRGLYLPSGSATTLEDQEYVSEVLYKMAEKYV